MGIKHRRADEIYILGRWPSHFTFLDRQAWQAMAIFSLFRVRGGLCPWVCVFEEDIEAGEKSIARLEVSRIGRCSTAQRMRSEEIQPPRFQPIECGSGKQLLTNEMRFRDGSPDDVPFRDASDIGGQLQEQQLRE